MPEVPTVNLARPIASAKVSDDEGSGQVDLQQDSGGQQGGFTKVFEALQSLADKLNQFYDKIFVEHKEQIAKLSVEIARKILAQKVQEGDYQIESIVKESIKNSPTRQNMVVHLNPEDLAAYEKLQQDEGSGSLAGIEFIGDPNIGRAECLVESAKGTIESLINEHLERIGKALAKVE